jgi:3-deoxy-D-manno-octulosonate 8-phosphate phosphatase KdsC-like HAD superfamily phosphatase
MNEIAYIGDDINDLEVLSKVGLKACPSSAMPQIQSIPGIRILNKKGGEGAVREFVEWILN